MALYVPFGNDYNKIISNFAATRPGTTTLGTLLTANATANAMGATWTTLFASGTVTDDVYGIWLFFHDAQSVSASLRSTLVDIGVDNAGGTTYRVVIPYLMAGHAASYTGATGTIAGGIPYFFPLYIPAGSSIAMRSQSATASSQVYVNCNLYCQPRRLDGVRVGTKVFQFGAQTATSLGTGITLGTTAEGNWSQLGSATTQKLWWWQCGYYPNDQTMGALAIHIDIGAGDATTKKILTQDNLFITSAAETIAAYTNMFACVSAVAPGDLIYGRGRVSGNSDTAPGVIAYGLGD